MDKLSFSLVTTCRNEIKSVAVWKNNIQAQIRQPNEIIIVDAFSNDGTYEFLNEWANTDTRIKVIQEKGAVAHGRNFAIFHSQFKYILSTDMGVRLNNIWCEELIAEFEKDNLIEIVVGNTCIDIDTVKSRVSKAEFILEKGGFQYFEKNYIPGNRSIAYKKNIWKQLGGLPEDLSFAADDSVFGRQMIQHKFKITYAPNAMTYWGRPSKLFQFFREEFVYGKGDGEAFIKTPRAFKWYYEKKIPRFLVPSISASLKILKIEIWRGVFTAFTKGDIISAFVIPILVCGKSYHHSKGYLIGFNNGNFRCLDCRKRLHRDKYGYSIL